MHGGTNGGAPKRNRNAWKHGDRSAEAEAQLRVIRLGNRNLRLIRKYMEGLPLQSWEVDRLFQILNPPMPCSGTDRAEAGAKDCPTRIP